MRLLVIFLALATSMVGAESGRAATEASTEPSETTTERASLVRVYDNISTNQTAAPRPGNSLLDPKLNGFFFIPGTRTRMKLGGYARASAMRDGTQVGDRDGFTTSSIPVRGEAPFGTGAQLNAQAKDSRMSFELRRPTSSGEKLRFYYESDFFGGGDLSPRSRHLYGQLGNLLAGHTFTLFRDSDAIPVTLDSQGPNAVPTQRQVQLRYTRELSEKPGRDIHVSVSVERPVPDIDRGLVPIARWPDAVLSWRMEESRFHVQVSGLVRNLAVESAATGSQEVTGWGATASGHVELTASDLLTVQVTKGDGIGRYLQDMTGLGLDAALDPAGRLRALRASGAVIGLQHQWTPQWQTNLAGGYLENEALPSQGPFTLTRSGYAAANLIYSPGPHSIIGVEVMHGSRDVASGADGEATRVQFTIQYDLFK